MGRMEVFMRKAWQRDFGSVQQFSVFVDASGASGWSKSEKLIFFLFAESFDAEIRRS